MTQHTPRFKPGENAEHDQPCTNPGHAGKSYALCGHTPGPWTAHDDDGTGTLPCVLSDKVNRGGNWYVAQCNLYEDARLIAAALEMLAELEKAAALLFAACECDEDRDCAYCDARRRIRALLARIEGKP